MPLRSRGRGKVPRRAPFSAALCPRYGAGELNSRKPWEAGDTVDGFRLERRLARGGMADLFVATPPSGGPPLVVKAIRDDCVGRDEMLRLFEREAALLPMLEHPSIVHVDCVRIDVWNSYIAMELLDGCDLRDLIRVSQATGRRIPLGICLRITLDVLDGLQYAHALAAPDGTPLGVVHRDVSPSNVMVTLDGRVKLLDFGIAKMQLNTPTSSRVGTKGKGCYMAPEQCQGLPVDPRTDIYAVGAVLYELSTSRRAFNGSNEMAVLHSILEGQFAPPTAMTPGYPESLEDLLKRALERDSDSRYQSAAEMAEAIREVADVAGIEVADRSTLQAFIGQFSALDASGELTESLSSLRSQGERQSLGARSKLASSDCTQADTSFVKVVAPTETSAAFRWQWLVAGGVAAVGLFGYLGWSEGKPSTAERLPLPPLVVPAAVLPAASNPVERRATESSSGIEEPNVASAVVDAGLPPDAAETPEPGPKRSKTTPTSRPSKTDRSKPEEPPEPSKPATGLRIDDDLRPPKL